MPGLPKLTLLLHVLLDGLYEFLDNGLELVAVDP